MLKWKNWGIFYTNASFSKHNKIYGIFIFFRRMFFQTFFRHLSNFRQFVDIFNFTIIYDIRLSRCVLDTRQAKIIAKLKKMLCTFGEKRYLFRRKFILNFITRRNEQFDKNFPPIFSHYILCSCFLLKNEEHNLYWY